MLQQILIGYVATIEIKLEFDLMVSIIQGLFFDQLNCQLVVELPIIDICQNDFQDLNINSASAEYPPLSFLGSCILWNSLDACATAAADTSAAIMAACLDSLIKVALGPMSNVQSLEIA